ncbi:MAG: DUF58 domain-containing protein [Phototrophicales bacterium]|nr:MAG: DUF58 domain-containing protein [Phototrophicales bacterium]RMG69887.1 MAG: DUF58 domain-containing protein [Chloroflexota bacterium]
MSKESLLLEETIRRKLDPLMLVARKVRAGAIKGERRSTKKGTSIEFADYRNYAPGDDLRRLDWNVYARTERPYIKLLEDEEDLAVHILLDASDSMNWPRDDTAPSDVNKLLFAKRLLAGLAYISLSSNDRLTLTAFKQDDWDVFGPARGRAQSVMMLRYAHQISASGMVDLNDSLKDYVTRAARPGLCFLITDMFSPSGYVDGLNLLIGKGYEVVLIHLLSPDEVTPPLVGDLRLIDVETSTAQEVSLDAGMRELYMRRVTAWREEIQIQCNKRGAHYLPLTTDIAWEKVLLYDLRKLSVVK